jgi:hypothetical protein
MRFLGRLILVLLAVVAVLIGASYLLPRHVTVARTITVEAPPEEIFPYVNSLQRFSEWSPWNDYDPEMEQRFSGPREGVGNRMEWASEDERVGIGSQVITLSEPNSKVETAVDFGGVGPARAAVSLQPVQAGTRVTWGLVADMGGSPVGRYMGLMMDRWVGADYERGLARLKATVEGG